MKRLDNAAVKALLEAGGYGARDGPEMHRRC